MVSPTSLFITHLSGVSHLSLLPWISKLAGEISSTAIDDSSVRMKFLLESADLPPTPVISLPGRKKHEGKKEDDSPNCSMPPACIVVSDVGLGNLLITTAADSNQPHAVELDYTELDAVFTRNGDVDNGPDQDVSDVVPLAPSRETYQPSDLFYGHSRIVDLIDRHGAARRFRNSLSSTGEIRLSEQTLGLLMEAHRVLRSETHTIALAASELFRRCDRLQAEFKEQISEANEAANRVEGALDDDADIYYEYQDHAKSLTDDRGETLDQGTSAKIDRRIQAVYERQRSLEERFSALRRKVQGGALAQGRPLNEKEVGWIQEVGQMGEATLESMDIGSSSYLTVGSSESESPAGGQRAPRDRYRDLMDLRDLLVDRSTEIVDHESEANRQAEKDEPMASMSNSRGEGSSKKSKMMQISAMLEREAAMVEATKERLGVLMEYAGMAA